MSKEIWNNDLLIGIPEIDEQHKALVNIFNELDEAVGQQKTVFTVNEIFTELLNSAFLHFETEEKYFDQYGYNYSTSHVREHCRLEDEILELKVEFDAGKMEVKESLSDFLKKWLLEHIKVEDQKFGQFYKKKISK